MKRKMEKAPSDKRKDRNIKIINEESIESADLSQDNNIESKEDDESEQDSVISELELDKVDNPRQRELLLLAKLKILQEKVKNKNTLITDLKETLEEDERIKKTMQNKIIELKEKINTLKSNMLNEGEYNNRADGEIMRLRENIATEEINREDENMYINNEDNAKRMMSEEDEEYLKKLMLEEDGQIRGASEYILASTAIANEHHNRIFIKKSKTCWGRFNQKLNNFLSFFTPFKEDMKHVSFKYDRDVQMYFEIHRFIFLLSMGIFLTYLYFLISHAILADYSPSDVFCKFNIPCVLLYSRVSTEEENAYSYTYLLMTLVIFYFSLMKHIKYSKLERSTRLYDREDYKFSQFFFKSWDWSTKTRAMYLEKKKRLRGEYKLSIVEVEIKEKVKLMTSSDKWCRFFLRVLSVILTLVIFVIYGVFIIGAYVIRAIMKDKSTNVTAYSAVDVIAEILPPVLIVIFNLAFPTMTRVLISLEKWDFRSTVRTQATIRYAITRLFGLACIYFVNIYFVLLGNNFVSLFTFMKGAVNDTILPISTHGCPGTYTLNTKYSDTLTSTPISKAYYSECAEDDAVINILFIVFADFSIRKIIDLLTYGFLYCCSSKRQRGESFKWPFRPGKAAVDAFMLTFQMLAVVTYFPYMTALIPLVLFVEFKFEMFKLTKMRSQPLKFSVEDENGTLIMNMFNFTYVSIVIFNTIFYIGKIPHNNFIECYNNPTSGNQVFIGKKLCGPYPPFTPVSETFVNGVNFYSFLRFIYYILSDPSCIILVLIFVVCMLLYNSEDVDSYLFYVKERENDMSNMINNLQNKLKYLKSIKGIKSE